MQIFLRHRMDNSSLNNLTTTNITLLMLMLIAYAYCHAPHHAHAHAHAQAHCHALHHAHRNLGLCECLLAALTWCWGGSPSKARPNATFLWNFSFLLFWIVH